MLSKRVAVVFALGLALLALPALTPGGEKKTQPKKAKEVWTDINDPTLPPDFHVQGEYVGGMQGGGKIGAQVIALGNGQFQCVILPGGLPGAGWDGKNKILMDGKTEEGKTVFTPTKGKRNYLAGPPQQFSATSKFPPAGHQEYTATLNSDGEKQVIQGQTDSGTRFRLMKTARQSPTLGEKPPKGALILFDGTNADEWTRGRIDKNNGSLNTDGNNILSKRKFNNYTMHLEFLLPYRPAARSQGRGNSGFYQVHHYEVQILDSFGLDGKNNECGGLYSQTAPRVNMCLPPLVWQTYDVEFTNAVPGEGGKVAKKARITLKHNGVVIHDDAEIRGPTGGHRSDPEGTPGPILLQGHGNPLQFRNIWIVEKK